MSERRPAPDQAERDAAVAARGENVLADAGAGTGKTTLLVARLVELVAPARDGLEAIPLERIAAVTFTRKAAGELKLRVREALLRDLAGAAVTPVRRRRLAAALGALDTAHVGTIHGFADRLLGLRPVEARLSPSYEVVEDAADLVAEAFAVFLQAVEAGTLADELAGRVSPEEAREAERAVVDAIRAGLRAETPDWEFAPAGLDRLFARFAETRDAPPAAPPAEPPDLGPFRALAGEAAALRGAAGSSSGSRELLGLVGRLERLAREEDPRDVLAGLVQLRGGRPALKKGEDFPDDAPGWKAWSDLTGDGKGSRATPILDDAFRPFARWVACRLVRAAPAFLGIYERVKERRRALDPVDLLVRLRDLLRDRPDIRAGYQALFDHVLVDELQDTDPLQAEIALFLCEDGARAASWREVRVAPGKLTLVGDPKQSIYRFRRADIAAYAEVRDLVRRGRHRVAKLSANFRCEPELVRWLNARMDDLLGRAGPDAAFDPAQGTVANEPLLAGREGEARPRVLALPLTAPGPKPRKEDYREAEARAIAAWLRRTVSRGERAVVDAATGRRRPAGYGDVAVLAFSTTQLARLFPELDRLGVPYAARGGSLFLRDPLHRQFLLALRALADRDDGVARAALLRPPFFALDLEDVAVARATPPGSADERARRARSAEEIVADLRLRRLERPPGATARDLLERTALGRAAALGPNGAQRLAALRELCHALDALAASEGLDYDGATARLRAWAEEPVALDPPAPVSGDAVQILTVHQAKGLEFPVVVLWDSCADLADRDPPSAWRVDRDGAAWVLQIDGLAWEEPEGHDLAGREKRYRDAERRRLVYVAATRARDLLVLPVAGGPRPGWVTGRLADGATPDLVETLEPYAAGAEPPWATEVPAPAPRVAGDAAALAARVEAAWSAASAEAARPRFAPTSVTAEAHRHREIARDGEAGPRRVREGRFGSVFGETVHRAIGLALREALAPEAAVERAAAATGLAVHRAEAAGDVRRALGALGRAGLRRGPGPDLRLEYPVALAEEGRLVVGTLDLLGLRAGGRLAVVDFKTDAPPRGAVEESHAAYVEQVKAYARIVEALGLAAPGAVDAGLLFTAEDDVRWIA